MQTPKNPIISYIRTRVHRQNKNFIASVTGETGSGKSFISLRFAELLDKNFNVDRICFSTEEFMECLNSPERKRGDVIVYDEAGVGHASRQFFSMSNQLMNYILQTFRHRNLIVFFTLPTLGMLDKQARQLLSATIETLGINYHTNTNTIKWINLQTNPRSGKIYHRHPQFYVAGRPRKWKRLIVDLPSKELVEAYEKKKDAFSRGLARDILTNIKAEKVKINNVSGMSPDEIVEDIKKDMRPYVRKYMNRDFVDDKIVRHKYHCTINVAKIVKNIIERELNVNKENNPEQREMP